VRFTTYLTHAGYVEAYRRVRNETPTKPMPANTLVIVESLVSPELLVEIDAIAVMAE
jgi:enamine deaminase RidA (YjgF/YER057c/UK114 family)